MKKASSLILGLVFLAGTMCRAQITEDGWFLMDIDSLPPLSTPTFTSNPLQLETIGNASSLNVPASPIAEVITPRIQALADGLQRDPLRIFNYVHDHIKFVLYFGSKKGAELTLLEKSGNDFDQSALLVALLRAAGCTNVAYQFGWQEIPYDDVYFHYDLHHWWQLTLSNTNWTNTSNYLINLINVRGYPIYNIPASNYFEIQRVWVALTIGSTVYHLDPAFKVSEPITPLSGFSLTNAMGGAGTTISNGLLTAAGGTDTGNYAKGLSESDVRSKLTSYTTNLLNNLQGNSPNASVSEILGGWQVTPAYDDFDFGTYPLFNVEEFSGHLPVLSWTNLPTNMMSTLAITFAGTNYQWYMPQLQGQRLALTFDASGTAQLWQDDTLLAQHTTSGSSGTTNVTLSAHHLFGTWNVTNNTYIAGTFGDQTATTPYQRTNSTYAILYAFEPDNGWLQQRQNKLDSYLQQGLATNSREVMSESLNVMGMNWMLQTAQTERMLATQLGILPQQSHRIGRMAQETGKGYYVDVYMQTSGAWPSGGYDAAHVEIGNSHFDLTSIFSSALEHGMIEQLQNSSLVAASTVKMLQIANTNGQSIFLTSSTNWTTGYNVRNSLSNYDAGTLTTIGNLVASNFSVLLPSNGSNHVSAASGSWAGYGYQVRKAVNGASSNFRMIVSGGYHGGFASDPGVPINPDYIGVSGSSQPGYLTATPTSTPAPTGADPVDLGNGTFQLENTDLSLGQAEPRGITLSRYYNGTRRFNNPAGMAGGWVHNYSMTANNVAATQAGLGGTTPAQAASMLTATTAAIAMYNGGIRNPKNWLTTALIAKWGVDQLTKNGVSINLGKDTLQFVQQPNGVFTPPANCSDTLTQSGSAYSLSQRHGNTFNFSTLGLLTSIVDQYNQSMLLSYNASNWISTVTDWTNRSLTFTYSGTPQRLTSVTDGTRTVYYGYATTYNSQGDLTTFTDAENKTNTYQYDTNHQIIVTMDAQSQLVVTNIYDSQGHITKQYTLGDTNKTWRIYWSGWQTTIFDPANGQQDYLYDDQGRLILVIDPLSHVTGNHYDGQNHITSTVSPVGALNQFFYDGNHCLTQSIDPLSFTNLFFYDGQYNLTRTVDPLGNTNYFGYNAQFSLVGSVNGAGDWITNTYNANGTLHTRVDPAGTTSYGYDSGGQLSSITYPSSLGTNLFVNSVFGDIATNTNPRGFSTVFQYNKRRQLTRSTAPTNLTVNIVYDPNGNVLSITNARAFTTTNLWSATGHLLVTGLPATAQGTPIVTSVYDSCDWLTKTLNPLQQPTFYTNDAAGRLVAILDPVLRTTRLTYDAAGRPISTVNAAFETNSQQWTARDQLSKSTNAANKIISRSYDPAGNLIKLTNRKGKDWEFKFDAANRLTNTASPLGKNMSQTYNNRGLLATVKDAAAQTASFNYDPKRRLTSRVDSLGTVNYGYDANDNITSVDENGQTNTWTFDAYDNVSTYKDSSGNQIQYRYNASGNLTHLTYPGNLTVTNTYDSLNRLKDVTDWMNRKTTFEYDLAGRLTSITRPNGTTRTNNYNPAGETTNIIEQAASKFPIAFYKLNWNAAARVQWEFSGPLPHDIAQPTRTMTFDDDNRLVTFNTASVTIDNNGNMTYGPGTNGTFLTYAYDVRNRLLNVGGVTNKYDPSGNRITVTSGTNVTTYVVDPTTSQALMRIKNGSTNYYIYGSGLLYEIDGGPASTAVLYYHYDYRGSTVALTDLNGNVTDRMEYSAYGTSTYRSGTNDTPFLYNGRYGVQTDGNGLLFMRARYYNPYICRFLNADPSGFAGGLNFYTYADGNPISLLDPFGLSAVGDYFSDVGQVFVGYGQAVGDTVGGLYNVGRHPINTVEGIYNVATHPVQAYNAISQGISDTWNSGLQGQGRIVGHVLITVATFGATKATSIAGRSSELVEVARWGRPGLEAGDWVMEGGKTPLNYRLSGKWQNGFGNEFASFESGEAFTVPRGDLYSPSGLNPFDGRLKSLVPGQMRYYPDGAGLLTPGEAGAITFGRAAGKVNK